MHEVTAIRRGRALLGLAALLLSGCTGDGAPRGEGHMLLFRVETQNLRALERTLQTIPPPGTAFCSELGPGAEARFGRIPHRLADEPATSAANALPFAVVYGEGDEPTVYLDLDGDGALGCAETLPMVPHPDQPGRLLRTFTLAWRGDGGPDRTQRYRLTLPTRLDADDDGDSRGSFVLDLVDVPVARWRRQGVETLWVLFDGNYNGLADDRFGDALVVDATGERALRLDPAADDVLSLHLPFRVPWGAYRVEEMERRGDGEIALTLREVDPATVPEAVTAEGEPVSVDCPLPDGGSARIGIPRDGDAARPQLVYFWLSDCGTCREDMERLAPVVEILGPERVRFVGVSFDEVRTSYDGFVERNGLEAWPQCFSGRAFWENQTAVTLDATKASSYILFDAAGRPLARGQGFDSLYTDLCELFPDLPAA